MLKRRLWNIRRRVTMVCGLALVASMTTVVLAAGPASADPGCQAGGVYVLWARGSGQGFNAVEATQFKQHVFYALGAAGVSPYDWAELGNLDGNFDIDPNYEYPATSVWELPWYGNSVRKGTDELVNHLNQRYGNGPGDRNCWNETAIIGGYSQGADVVGWALERDGGGGYVALSAAAKSHIGFVALYGDPKNIGNGGQVNNCLSFPWVRGNAPCAQNPVVGFWGSRSPYVRSEFWSRVGSWCDQYDGFCNNQNASTPGSHMSTYRDWWIWQSAGEIVETAATRMPSGTPIAVSRTSGTLDVFYRGADHSLVNRGWDVNLGWRMTELVDGSSANNVYSNPSAVRRDSNHIEVFWRSASNNLVSIGWDVNTGWGPPVVRASGMHGDPTVISRTPDSLDVFFKDENNNLRNIGWNATNGWGPVVTRASNVAGSPKAVARNSSNMDVFYRGTNGNLMSVGWNVNTGWGPAVSRGSNMVGDPAVAARTDGNMEVFYAKTTGNLASAAWDWRIGWNGQEWSAGIVGNPTVVARDSGNLNVFFRRANGELVSHGWNWQTGWHQTVLAQRGVYGDPMVVARTSGNMEVLYSKGYTLGNTWWDASSGWHNQDL